MADAVGPAAPGGRFRMSDAEIPIVPEKPEAAEPEVGGRRRFAGWGVPASVLAHALIAAVLLFELPLSLPRPSPPEPIAVVIVPPPEPEPEPAPEEQPKPEEPTEPEETPPPEQPAGEEQAAEQPPEQTVRVLRPVFEFGEADTGPEQAEEGSASSEPAPEVTAETPAPDRIDDAAVPLPASRPEPETPPEPELTEVRTLFSRAITDDPVAMTAMAGMPRGLRAGELCATELREQLRRADPPRWPDLLPAYRLPEGTVMQVRRGAFRAGGQWYDLSFRCEIDAEATQVVSFAFTVGAAVPREQWQARGFPAN